MRGAIATAFGLIILQVALSTPLAGLLGAAAAPAQWARAWMDPGVPLIPALKTVGSSVGTGLSGRVNTKLPPSGGSSAGKK